MGVLKLNNEQDLLPVSKEITVLWWRQIRTEIIQKGKKGALQVMSVGAENGSS